MVHVFDFLQRGVSNRDRELLKEAGLDGLLLELGVRIPPDHVLSIMKGGTQGFPRHEVSDKQEVLFENVSPSTAFSIRQHILSP